MSGGKQKQRGSRDKESEQKKSPSGWLTKRFRTFADIGKPFTAKEFVRGEIRPRDFMRRLSCIPKRFVAIRQSLRIVTAFGFGFTGSRYEAVSKAGTFPLKFNPKFKTMKTRNQRSVLQSRQTLLSVSAQVLLMLIAIGTSSLPCRAASNWTFDSGYSYTDQSTPSDYGSWPNTFFTSGGYSIDTGQSSKTVSVSGYMGLEAASDGTHSISEMSYAVCSSYWNWTGAPGTAPAVSIDALTDIGGDFFASGFATTSSGETASSQATSFFEVASEGYPGAFSEYATATAHGRRTSTNGVNSPAVRSVSSNGGLDLDNEVLSDYWDADPGNPPGYSAFATFSLYIDDNYQVSAGASYVGAFAGLASTVAVTTQASGGSAQALADARLYWYGSISVTLGL